MLAARVAPAAVLVAAALLDALDDIARAAAVETVRPGRHAVADDADLAGGGRGEGGSRERGTEQAGTQQDGARDGQMAHEGVSDQLRLAASPTRRAMTIAGNRTPSVAKKVASILAKAFTA